MTPASTPYDGYPEICDARISDLVTEIRDLYLRQCELATRVNAGIERTADELKERVRPRAHRGLPELERFETVFDSQEALQRAHNNPRIRRRLVPLQMLTLAALAAACMMITVRVGNPGAVLVVVPIGAGVLFWENRVLFRRCVRRILREQLIERGVPICLECGYDLRGQVEPRCPECGASCSASLIKPTREN